MGSSVKKKVCILFFLFAILFSVGCGNTTSDGITLTITEQATIRHMEQPSTTTTQEIGAGDAIRLEMQSGTGGTVTIIEIRDNSVMIQYDGLWSQDTTYSMAYGIAEIEFGQEYELITPTLSSWVRWILVFEQ